MLFTESAKDDVTLWARECSDKYGFIKRMLHGLCVCERTDNPDDLVIK